MKAIKKKERPSGMDGAWIDFTIVNGLGLTDQEKILFSMIFHLSKRQEGCTATNLYFAEIMEKSEKAISEAISRMARKGFVRVRLTKTKLGTLRVMFANVKVQKPTPQNEVEATPQTENPTPYGVDSSPQNMDATTQDVECMHSTGYGSDIKEIKKKYNKEIEKGPSSLSGQSGWYDISERAKDLILHDWGEYDHNPDKETYQLLAWEKFQEGQKPEVVLETIRKLIRIRKSEQFKTNTFWQSIPVNIASSFSYKDHIKNAYNALLLLAETKSNPSKAKSTTVDSKSQSEKQKQFSPFSLVSSYASFEDWAKSRLTRSSLEEIRRIKRPDEMSENLRLIYDKFVNEEGGTPVLHSSVIKEAV
ncbi:helix-turn-helix domain-containing protein [Leptospira ellisii]|uniref:Helix-turn-helix domain-containing protein n=1 Tax=Leptospira ellisii TaxID=2023197 RepID=A0A2N0B8D2_9LEPT|nr:helix-turn-helix domain-containing protein [Leptospira ellisii]MDV6237540.1 helix-turn-helix domain-containing protein [Leptospira ellisii]PJZ92811.1 helix-turn-helix domain-containing protein [Leptospira ellisii]PKA05191.1 helix-turn-helix domain-containing protein [Leptospira ellisii]